MSMCISVIIRTRMNDGDAIYFWDLLMEYFRQVILNMDATFLERRERSSMRWWKPVPDWAIRTSDNTPVQTSTHLQYHNTQSFKLLLIS